jgi:hypothetical protein
MAEESILAMVLTEPALFDQTADLTAEMFSAPVLGRAFAQLKQRFFQGLEVSPGVLEDFSSEEMSHLVSVTQRLDGPVNRLHCRIASVLCGRNIRLEPWLLMTTCWRCKANSRREKD